jgi:ABC-type glycerol-3-phosphate transport system substrate-binding protein
MKKNVLALSIAAMIGGLGFAGAASADVIVGTGPSPTQLTATNATALTFARDGIGHNLLVPYFNAQNGNMSVIHVVNTDTTNGKAVKVRFRGASNSDDILDFQVFLSPGDVWTAAVTANGGVAQLSTAYGQHAC